MSYCIDQDRQRITNLVINQIGEFLDAHPAKVLPKRGTLFRSGGKLSSNRFTSWDRSVSGSARAASKMALVSWVINRLSFRGRHVVIRRAGIITTSSPGQQGGFQKGPSPCTPGDEGQGPRRTS